MALFVNGESIPQELIDIEAARLSRLPAWHSVEDPAERDAHIRRMATGSVIDRILIRQFADSDPSPVDPRQLEECLREQYAQSGFREINRDNAAKLVEQQLRLARAMKLLSGDTTPVELEEAKSFYQQHSAQFGGTEKVKVAHIVVNVDETRAEAEAREKIEAALRALNNGEPFAGVAARYSDCPERGGELEEFARGVMVDEFEEVAFGLPPGTRSAVFRTPFGFHILEVRERATRPPDFELVAGQILEYLNMRKQQQGLSEALSVLRSGARIVQTAETRTAHA